MKPIPEWRKAWRMASVQVGAVAVLWGLLPQDQQAAVLGLLGIPAERVTAALGLAFIVARLVSQPKVSE